MKPILIEDLIQAEFTVDVDGKEFKGWQIAKPMNYDPEYLSLKDRTTMAQAVINGKAIAVCFFEDLSEEDQVKFVKRKMD